MSFFKTLWKLCPVEIGPWWPLRQYVRKQVQELKVVPGDILLRKGNAYVYGFVPFSETICYLTGSHYSHAALVLDVTEDDVLLADVNTTGLRRQFIADWCDDIRGDDILVMRFSLGDKKEKEASRIRALAVENARIVLGIDPIRDDEFLNYNEGLNWYCVELVCWCYLRAGIMLCEDIPICKLPKWRKWLNPIARFHGVNYNAKVWCVGNQDVGLLSSPYLKELGRIPYKQVTTQVRDRERQIFQGA